MCNHSFVTICRSEHYADGARGMVIMYHAQPHVRYLRWRRGWLTCHTAVSLLSPYSHWDEGWDEGPLKLEVQSPNSVKVLHALELPWHFQNV